MAVRQMLAAVTVVVVSTSPLFAHDLFIVNHSDQDIISISARPGKVEDFKRVRWGTDRKFEITLPKGECETLLTIRVEDGQSSSTPVDVCGGLKLVLGARPRGH